MAAGQVGGIQGGHHLHADLVGLAVDNGHDAGHGAGNTHRNVAQVKVVIVVTALGVLSFELIQVSGGIDIEFAHHAHDIACGIGLAKNEVIPDHQQDGQVIIQQRLPGLEFKQGVGCSGFRGHHHLITRQKVYQEQNKSQASQPGCPR